CFFFFQAEDGIRDRTVTGVQTCALPISRRVPQRLLRRHRRHLRRRGINKRSTGGGQKDARHVLSSGAAETLQDRRVLAVDRQQRSEERRVGKEWRAGGGPQRDKKKHDRR